MLAIGSKVKLRHTGDEAEVLEMLPNGMVNVYLYDADMDIPVFADDLISVSDKFTPPPRKKTPVVPEVPKSVSPPAPPQDAENQYIVLKSVGLQLAFEPVLNDESETDYYNVWLLNDAKDEFIITLKMKVRGETESEFNDKISAMSKTSFGRMAFDTLNDNPVFEIQKWRVTTTGSRDFAKSELKIKPKTFFSKVKTAPFLNKPVHLFLIFDKNKQKKKDAGEDLRSYTKRHASVRLPRNEEERKRFNLYDVEEFASFEIELDLHTEKLGTDTSGMDNSQILRLQMQYFDGFLTNAVRIGVPRVFVIHGVGKGKLKNLIATRLINHPDVKTFRNEYHPRYGWGATEIEL